MTLNLLDGTLVDQGAVGTAEDISLQECFAPQVVCHVRFAIEAIADFERRNLLREPRSEVGVDRGLDVDTVCTDTGLAAPPELASDCTCACTVSDSEMLSSCATGVQPTGDSGVNICIIEDHEGCITASFDGDPIAALARSDTR